MSRQSQRRVRIVTAVVGLFGAILLFIGGAKRTASVTNVVASSQAREEPPPGTLESLLRAGFRRADIRGRSASIHGPFRLSAKHIARLARKRIKPDREGEAYAATPDPCPACLGGAKTGESEPLDGTLPQTPPPTSKFTYPMQNNDPQIAASTTHLVVTQVKRVLFFEKGGKNLLDVKAKKFFDPVIKDVNSDPFNNLQLPLSYGPQSSLMGLDATSDTRAVFDGFRRRFWVTTQLVNLQKFPDPANNPGCKVVGSETLCPALRHIFAVAVSTTEDPRDDWHMYWWPEILNNGQPFCENDCDREWNADYPAIGVSDHYFAEENLAHVKKPKSLYYTTQYRRIVVAPADLLAAGGVCNDCALEFGDLPDGHPLEDPAVGRIQGEDCEVPPIVPAVHHDAEYPGAFFFASTYPRHDTCPNGKIVDYSVMIWVLYPAPTPHWVTIEIPIPGYRGARNAQQRPVPPNQFGPGIPTPQILTLSNMGSRMLKAAYRANHIYGVWAVSADTDNSEPGDGTDEACIRLFRVQLTGSPNHIDRSFGTRSIDDDPNWIVHYGWPAVEVNKDGNMAVVYVRSGTEVFPQARYSVFMANGADILPSRRLQAGSSPIGVDRSTTTAAETGRLDTAGISVDPFDDTSIWMAHGYGVVATTTSGQWRLVVGKVFGGAIADLFVTPVDRISPKVAGDPLQFTAVVGNQGDGTTSSPALGVYWSDDPFLSFQDTPLATIGVNTLGPSTQQVVTVQVTVPSNAVPGVRYVILLADPTSVIPEYTNVNNFAVVPVTIHRRPSQ